MMKGAIFMFYDLSGTWDAELADGTKGTAVLPGTLDENKLGHKDAGANQWHPDASIGNAEDGFDPDAPIATRFTRKHTFEGEARLSRKVSFVPAEGKRVFLEAERARCLRLLVDGKEVEACTQGTISTPYVFEVTGLLNGDNEITLLSDNSYPGLPHDAIVYSSAATDETQTNWNGVIGFLRLRVEEPVFLSGIRVYPRGDMLDVKVEVSADRAYKGSVTIASDAILNSVSAETITKKIEVEAGTICIEIGQIPVAEDIKRWDEYEGNLYEMTARIEGYDEKTVTFGVRDFGDDGKGRLALNGRTIFLRSEANCAEFPEEGHPPTSVEAWTTILNTYKSYGINCMRFHSHCPPEGAFVAADQIGMMMQPELSHWNPKNAFEPEDSFNYYQVELKQVIRMLANHPSFVMLTYGNELWTGDLGHKRMDEMIEQAHALDTTRLYANGSNPHYGTIGCDAKSDFYTSQIYLDFTNPLRGTFAGMPEISSVETEDGSEPVMDMGSSKEVRIKGYINNQYPNATTNYDVAMENLRKTYDKPVFGFEVGQFEVLPYFEELDDFKGISDPANYRLIQEKADKLGLLDVWNRYVEATGEISRIGYREEIEAAMRTRKFSGLSLLGLQDFPGQGTALVGMINSHLEPKPFDFAKPEAFEAFFRDQLPLVQLPKYTYEIGERLEAEVLMANYGKRDLSGELTYTLSGDGVQLKGTLPQVCCPMSELTMAGKLDIDLGTIEKAVRLDLSVELDGAKNTYPIWVYPAVSPICPEGIYETEQFDETAQKILDDGGRVYLTPKATKEAMPSSIQTQFTSDFWSVGTFPAQAGGMGQLIDTKHPIFEDFPTEPHTNWQWWAMASQRALILPEPVKAIVTEMDSYAYMRPMAQLLECKCGNGRLMVSSMALQDLQQYPEGRALQAAIYKYMDSEKFVPAQEIAVGVIAGLF
ncbi:MAG: hypothetical protein EOM18_00260 [Clostridia bacterium]|nr:hypothetical protein [Clostridia bacterium]